MPAGAAIPDSGVPASPTASVATRPTPRLWLPLTLVALYWAYVLVTNYLIEMPMFPRFLSQTAVLLGVVLVFLIWWICNRRIAGRDRLIVLAAAIASPVLAKCLADPTLGPIPIVSGLPILITAWAAWMLVARKATLGLWRIGLILVLFLSTGVFTLFRMEGLGGTGAADLHWRWSATPEERYLARVAPPGAAPSAGTQPAPLSLRPGDWPGFRGANRDGVVRGVRIATDWDKTPPRAVWRRAIGPGWGSVAILDGRLFTQEQRGDQEVVVCLDAATGSEVWAHQEQGRFWDPLSSAGPRATPTFTAGRIYAQGATGTLVCLDAAGGRKFWSRNILKDAGAKLPQWGVASSPLVTGGLVIVYAGGEGGKALLAYRADTGEPAWSADAGRQSYSSPQLAYVTSKSGEVLFISDRGLLAVEPQSGKTLWEYRSPGTPPRSCQPLPVGATQLLVPMGMEVPTDLVDVTRSGNTFTATKVWTSRSLKPSFNDCVVCDGHIYGFDGTVFTCVELQTGNRKWRQGNYGTGQVLLLGDQPLLLVLTERGQVVLVKPNPDHLDEVGRFDAIAGKTWNHPAMAQGRLYVRNAQEIACYDLAPLTGAP